MSEPYFPSGPRIVHPLILRAAERVNEAQAVLESAYNRNAAVPDEPPIFNWVLVQRAIGFDVTWYLTTLQDALRDLDRTHREDTVWHALNLQPHQQVRAMQLSELDKATPRVAVVLTGNVVFGLIEPMLYAEGPDVAVAPLSPPVSPPSVDRDAPNVPRMQHAKPPDTSSTPKRPKYSSRGIGVSRDEPAPFSSRDGGTDSGATDTTDSAPLRLDAVAFVDAPHHVQHVVPFDVEIGLEAITANTAVEDRMTIAFAANERTVTMSIQVACVGFTSSDGFEFTLPIARSNPFGQNVKFSLTATALPDGMDEEVRLLQVYFASKGMPCGRTTRRILVQRMTTAVDAPSAVTGTADIAIDETAPAIDLTLRCVWQDDNEATHRMLWSYETPHQIDRPKGKLERASSELASLPIGIVDELAQGDGLPGIELLMGGLGQRIADEIPAGVWEVVANVEAAVRKARGNDQVPTVLLATQEPRVPWELALVPEQFADPARARHLNTQCIVTRWLIDDNLPAMPPYLPESRDVIAIFGDYTSASGVAPLPNAIKEAKLLETHKASAFSATRQSVVDILMDNAKRSDGTAIVPGMLHFAGHGEAGRSGTAASFMMLNDGSTLSATYFINAPTFRKHHPLVFLNACQLGAGNASLGQSGGFAAVCVRARCSAVVAPLWSVNDHVAFQVASQFYDDVLDGKRSVAEALFDSRKQPLTDVEVAGPNGVMETRKTATRMAYLVYGHPHFRYA